MTINIYSMEERMQKNLFPLPAPSFKNKVRRFIWNIVQGTLFFFSPIIFHGWRRFLVRCFGATVSPDAIIYPTTVIWAPWHLSLGSKSCLGPFSICYNVAPISVGADVVISQGVHLCAASHDHRSADFTLIAGPIAIGDSVWVAAEAFIGPGVKISEYAIVGARAVVFKDIPIGAIVVGNPAQIKTFRRLKGSDIEAKEPLNK